MSNHTLVISAGFVAGIPHRNPDLSVVLTGHDLVVVPEPENPHDPEAIKLIHQLSGQFLGYVPREQTISFHQAKKEGFEVECKVTCLQPQVKWKELGYGAYVSFELPS